MNAVATNDTGITKQYARLIQPNARPMNAVMPTDSVVAATITGKKNTYGKKPVTAHSAASVAASVIERVSIFISTLLPMNFTTNSSRSIGIIL